MRHALFVAFQYPPDAGSSGVLRTLKYTRYLADHGWRVTVLGPDVDAYDSVDAATLSEIPAGVKVVRTRFLDSRRHLGVRGRYLALTALPDRFVGWLPWALPAGLRVARADPVDLVYSTSPPATAHLIAAGLANVCGTPWVADFRDPWFEEPPEPGAPAGRLFRAIDRRLEARVVRRCSRLVTTTGLQRDALQARYPALPAGKFEVIPNGYDEADFEVQPPAGGAPSAAVPDGLLRIVHAGSINPHFRDPLPLFEAIRLAARAGRLDPQRVRLRFLGGGAYAESSELRRAAADRGLAGQLEIVPRLPYAQALRELADADILLLLQASDDTRALVPAKLYEYLRMARPVLALTLPGEVDALLGRTGGGHAVDPADVQSLATTLGLLYARWQDGTLAACRADPAALRRYERRTLAGELARLFDRAVADEAGRRNSEG